MRTLKKALSLVLVLAMVFALAVPGFAADTTKKASDFKDYSKVTNKEAVDVLTAVGVINGNADGTFNPEGSFTRAEAATMITYLTLGKTVANALPVSATKFSDVPATHWAAKYVQYCADAKIVNGVGDGKFDPDAKLTATQWSLMLLGALGYNAKNEGIGGEGWEIATTKLAMKAGVASAEDLTATFNRDMAAKLALNALKADVVEYATNGTNITIGDTTINTGASKATAVEVDAATNAYASAISNATGTTSTKVTVELGEKLYNGKLELKATAPDAFGRPSQAWEYKDKEVASAVSTAALTFKAATSAADVAKALKGYTVKDNTAGTPVVKDMAAKGYTTAAVYTANGATATGLTVTSAKTLPDVITDLIKNGKVVEIYADTNKNITKVVELTYTVDKVSGISETKDGDYRKTQYSATKIGSLGCTYTDPDKTNTVVLTGAVAKGDVVTVLPLNGVTYVYPTTKVSGTQSAFNNGKGTITVASTVYTVGTGVIKTPAVSGGAAAVTVAMADFQNSTVTANYFVDQFGNVVLTDNIESTDYAVIDAVKWTSNSTVLDDKGAAAARLIFADGTTQNVTLKKVNGFTVESGSTAKIDAVDTTSGKVVVSATQGDNTAVFAGQIVTYTKNSDGTYDLTVKTSAAKATTAAAATVVTKGVPAIATISKSADNNTVYIVKTNDAKGAAVYNAYTGYKNVPTVAMATGKTATITYVAPTSGALDYVFIDATAGSNIGDTVAGDVVYIFNKDNYYTEGTGSNQTYVYCDVAVNGVATEKLTVKATNIFTANGLYVVKTNDNGVVTEATVQNTGTTFVKTTLSANAANGIIGTYTYDGTEKVYVIDDNSISEGTAESAQAGDTIYVKVVKDTTHGGSAAENIAVQTMYIVKA